LNAAERTRFRHRLLGLDAAWHDVGARREAVFTSLAPGDYRFEVMAVQGDADNTSEVASVAFRLPPAFHQSPQFLLLWAALIAGLGVAVHLLRVRRIKARLRARQDAQRDERARIARELHDTLLQGMQGTLLRLQAAADALPEGERARQSINEAIDRAEQVLIEGRDRVQGIRDFDGAASGLDQRIEALAAELNGAGELALRVTRRGEPAVLAPDVHDEVLRIVREAVLNACQHAAASVIEVLVEWSAGELRLVVRDDGSGIEPDVLQRGTRPGHWGMAGMRERASVIGANLDIRSAAGVGTEVELRLPCRRRRSRWWRR
jgi:signal transduction histidine kinase